MAEKILIVDDDLDTLKLVGLMLKGQGYDIVAASGGSQALAKAASETPDLILLDVMMPDMDGYEVTRRIRANDTLKHIPIIMFTAKTQVDDKVAGFEAGVDDFMTKPTHPAELTSRVKALLARSVQTRAAPVQTGRIIGVIGAKGGLGTTTVALNLAVSLVHDGQDVIMCDLRPGQGTLGLQLGFQKSGGLVRLLHRQASDINPTTVENELVHHASGLRLLLASHQSQDLRLSNAGSQAAAIVVGLADLSRYLVLDLGSGIDPLIAQVVSRCNVMILTVEPSRLTLTIAGTLMEDLENLGVPKARVEIAMVNRTRSSLQIPWQTAETLLGQPIGSIITPAPELAYHAAEDGVPMVEIQPDSLTADQFRQLKQRVLQRLGSRATAGH